jgi:hypothetical protein
LISLVGLTQQPLIEKLREFLGLMRGIMNRL